MIVDRVNHHRLNSEVQRVSKAVKAILAEKVHQVAMEAKETEAAMVLQAAMACLADQVLTAFLVEMDSLEGVEDRERMACLV